MAVKEGRMQRVLATMLVVFSLHVPVLAQEPTKLFDPVEPPDWIWTGLNQMFDISSVEAVETAARMGVQVGYSFGDRKLVEAAHRHGMRLIGASENTADAVLNGRPVLEAHPDWQVRFGDDPWPPQKRGCILSSPYRQVFIDAFVTAEKKYGFDGF